MPRPLILFLTLWIAPTLSQASISNLSLKPTEISVGVSVDFDSTNTNASAQIKFKRSSETQFLEGVKMVRPPILSNLTVLSNRWVGSILNLEAGVTYDVQVIAFDSAGTITGTLSGSVTTLHLIWPSGGRVIHVTPPASSTEHPVQVALSNAVAGDTISIDPGTYYDRITITQSGTAQAPIHIVNSSPSQGPVIIDGSDGLPRRTWTTENSALSVYSIALNTMPTVVVADDQRLFWHATLASLQSGISWSNDFWSPTQTITDGYYYDRTNKRLYLRLPANFTDRDPSHHDIHISSTADIFAPLMTINGSYIDVDGIEFRYFSIGARIEGDNIRVANSTFRYIQRAGIFSKSGTTHSLFEKNLFFDNNLWNWPWYAMKNYEVQAIVKISNETNAFSILGISKASSIFRNNTVDGTANGFSISEPNCDIYDNTIIHVADDAFEPDTMDGSTLFLTENLRFFRNKVDQVFTGISLAPADGVMYLFDNSVANYTYMGVKSDGNDASYGPILLWNNSFVSRNGRLPTSKAAQAFNDKLEVRNFELRNNILYSRDLVVSASSSSGIPSSSNSFDWNALFTSGSQLWSIGSNTYNSISAIQSGLGFEINGFEFSTDPWNSFENAAAGNLTPLLGSAVIDHGSRIPGFHCPATSSSNTNQHDCRPWYGSQVDIGAKDYVSTTVPVDTSPPSVPTGVQITLATSSQLNFTWQASVDEAEGSGLQEYRIYRGTDAGSLTFLKSVVETSTFDATVNPNTTYFYAVSAIDNSGNESAKSSVITITTPDLGITLVPTPLPLADLASPQGALSPSSSLVESQGCSASRGSLSSFTFLLIVMIVMKRRQKLDQEQFDLGN